MAKQGTTTITMGDADERDATNTGPNEFDRAATQSYALNPKDRRNIVSYFYNPDIGSYYYGPGHPMKPQRIRMAHALILGYDLYKHLEVYRPHSAEHIELTSFHEASYVNFLSEISVDAFKAGHSLYSQKMRRFNLGEADCPIFDGLYEFQASCAGASIDCAVQVNHKNCDIAINWSGGLHHAKRAEAAGFCYINDIVLSILELLKYHTRVIYIDIDVHHGDGVEEAFYLTNRVMTVSFHKYGDFFPGTGDVVDIGAGCGKYYAVNVPLSDGVTDAQFVPLYKDVIGKCLEVFKPEAIVLQCGADSITEDRLGNFNLTTYGHGACVEWTKNLGYPLVVLGGGGYTIRNVARAWLYETAIVIDKKDEIDNKIPLNEYLEYFAPYYNLHLEPDPSVQNRNSDAYIASLREKIFSHLRQLEGAPSVQFSHVPPDFFNRDLCLEDDTDEVEQLNVDWDGGGLGLDLSDDFLTPLFLHRPDRARGMDFGGEDRDQKKKISIFDVPGRPGEAF